MGIFDQIALRGGTIASRALRGQREGQAEQFKRDRLLTDEQLQRDQLSEQTKFRAAQQAATDAQRAADLELRKEIQLQSESYRRDALKQTAEQREADRVAREQQFHEGEEGRNERAQDRLAGQRDLARLTSTLRTERGRDASFQELARLRNEFTQINKPYAISSTAAKQAELLSKDKTGQSDMALMYSYIKVLDPESVVREGEYAVASRAASVPDRIGNLVRRTLSGQQLSPEQRENLVAAIRTRAGPMRDQYLRSRNYYGELTKRFQGDPFEVLGPDPDEPAPKPPRPPLADIAAGRRP